MWTGRVLLIALALLVGASLYALHIGEPWWILYLLAIGAIGAAGPRYVLGRRETRRPTASEEPTLRTVGTVFGLVVLSGLLVIRMLEGRWVGLVATGIVISVGYGIYRNISGATESDKVVKEVHNLDGDG